MAMVQLPYFKVFSVFLVPEAQFETNEMPGRQHFCHNKVQMPKPKLNSVWVFQVLGCPFSLQM